MNNEITPQEAIERIEQDLKVNGKYLSSPYKKALRLAIKALGTERFVAEILPEHCIDSDCRGCYNKCTWFKCSKCSCAVDKEDRFCKHCGAQLYKDTGDNKNG